MAIDRTDPNYMYTDPTITSSSVIQGKDASELGMDDFFNLLVAQLTNQDMMNPTNDTEFIAQMAQFSSLQGMKTLQEYQLSSYAASYIGKFVTIANITETGAMETIVGKVDSITYYDGKPKVVVNGKGYDLFTVMEINDTDGSGALAQALKFRNHEATVEFTDEEGLTSQISGTVTGIGVRDGKPFVTIGGKNYAADTVVLVEGKTVEEFLASLEETDPVDDNSNNNTTPSKPVNDSGKAFSGMTNVEFMAFFDRIIGRDVTFYNGSYGTVAYARRGAGDSADDAYLVLSTGAQILYSGVYNVDGKGLGDFLKDNPYSAGALTDLPRKWEEAIGFEVQASTWDASKKSSRQLSGLLTEAGIENGKVYAVINGKRYDDVLMELIEGKSPADWLAEQASTQAQPMSFSGNRSQPDRSSRSGWAGDRYITEESDFPVWDYL